MDTLHWDDPSTQFVYLRGCEHRGEEEGVEWSGVEWSGVGESSVYTVTGKDTARGMMLGKEYQELIRNVEVMLAELRLNMPDHPLWADTMDMEDEMRDPTFDPFPSIEYGPKDCVTSYLDEVRPLLGKLWCELDENEIFDPEGENPFPNDSPVVHGEARVENSEYTPVASSTTPPPSPTEIIMAPIGWGGRPKEGERCKIGTRTRSLSINLASRKGKDGGGSERQRRAPRTSNSGTNVVPLKGVPPVVQPVETVRPRARSGASAPVSSMSRQPAAHHA